MIRLPLAFALSSLVFAGLVGGCSSSTSTSGSLPPGVGLTCGTSTSAATNDEVAAKLASATSGTCVVLTSASYVGPFNVPAGVTLVAQNGSRAAITGGTAQTPAVTLAEGGGLVDVDVTNAGGVAVAIRAANALIYSLNVKGAQNAALAVLCTESATPGCATGKIALGNVSLQSSTLGLWVSGAHVVWSSGDSSNHTSTSLASAAGIIAESGAQLELSNVTVQGNQGVGILIDGAATKANITNGTIDSNSERGLWVQNVVGTLDTPSVMVQNTNFSKNKIVGVGAIESHGIIIVGGSVVSTVAAPQVTNLATTEMIGDGFGLFSSADVKFDSTTIGQNDRAGGVIDIVGTEVLTGIIIVGGAPVNAGASGLKVVVQNTSNATVQIPTTDESMPSAPLGVSAPTLSLPGVL